MEKVNVKIGYAILSGVMMIALHLACSAGRYLMYGDIYCTDFTSLLLLGSLLLPRCLSEGGMGVYGIAVLGFFSCAISVILILTCGIAVSSSSAVCGFSSFLLTVFGEIRLFTVLQYRLLGFPFDTIRKTKHSRR